jgi:carnitine-CoA ligase
LSSVNTNADDRLANDSPDRRSDGPAQHIFRPEGTVSDSWMEPIERTLTSMLLDQAERIPRHRALAIVGESVTYEELAGRSHAAARGLRQLGVGRGDVVAMLAENSLDHALVEFGTARIGALEVMINTAYRGEFLSHQLNVSGARVFVVDEHLLPFALQVVPDVPTLEKVLVRNRTGELGKEGTVEILGTDVLFDHARDLITDIPDPLASDPSSLVFTSGTTGPSKAAMMTQNYMCTLAELESSTWYRSENDSFYSCGPLFHLAAKGVGVLGAIFRGVTCVQDERFSVSGFWSRVREENCTATLLLGSMTMLLWGREPSPEEGIDVIVGVPIPAALQDEMARRWRCKFESVYGLSEAAPVTGTSRDVLLRPGSAGKVYDKYYDVRIFDDDDREVPAGTVGEVVIRPRRAHVMFEGYYRDPVATVGRYQNLWFHSGDLGKFDEDGYFYFVDRKKDYLRRRGENISSFEVESVIAKHPAVLEAAVVGVASELTEEEVKAVVVLHEGVRVDMAELVEHCIANMPYFAVPRYIEIVSDLPRTPSGKVEKHKLRSAGHDGTWDREAAGIVLSGKNARTGCRVNGVS